MLLSSQFLTGTEDWEAINSSTLETTNDKLNISGATTGIGAVTSLSLKNNTNYTLNFDLVYSSNPSDITVTLKDQSQTTIYSGNASNASGVNTLAMSLGTFTNPLTLEISNSGSSQTYSIDNLTLTQDGIAGVSYYTTQLVSAQDYYPFGTTLPGRTFQDDRFDGYRFAFNGKEADNEINGTGNDYDFGARIYDARLGRFLSLDPLKDNYPSESNYMYCSNNPIYYVDKEGEKKITYIEILHKDGSKSIVKIVDETKVKNIRVVTTLFGKSTGGYNDVDYDLVQFYSIDENTGKIKGTPEIVTNPTKDILDDAIDGFNEFLEGLKAKEGSKEGGIAMTASEEFNAAETQFFADAKYKELPINVESLMMARGGATINTNIKLTGMVPEVKELLIKVEKIKGALGGIDVGSGIGDVNNFVIETTKPKLFGPGSDSCTYCHEIDEQGKMNGEKHKGITQTKTTQTKTKSE